MPKTRDEAAREAFWGKHPPLMDLVEDRRGYEEGGVWYPANGMTLAECIETVLDLSEDEFLAVAALA